MTGRLEIKKLEPKAIQTNKVDVHHSTRVTPDDSYVRDVESNMNKILD